MADQNRKKVTGKRPRRKRHILRKILVLLIVLLVIAGAGYYGYLSLKAEYTTTYTGYTATTGSISNALSFSGSLSLINNQTYSAAEGTTVRSIYVQAGDSVSAGDRLMRLANGETIKADFDGRVNSIKVSEGEEVSAGTALIQIADFSRMKVSIRVDEYDIADVSVGQRCTVTATATEQQFESQIDTIDYISASSGNVAYYTATCLVDVGEGIYPGMQVTISVPQEEAENVVILKMDALSFDETNSAFVYMYNESGELAPVPVEVGVSNGNYVEIKNGLKAGDEVYAEVKVSAEASALSGLLSGLFGGQNVMGGRNGRTNFNGQTGGFSQMPSGGFSQMPSGSGFGGGFGGGNYGGGSR